MNRWEISAQRWKKIEKNQMEILRKDTVTKIKSTFDGLITGFQKAERTLNYKIVK